MSKSVEARLAHQVSITSDDYARIRRNHPKVQVGSLAWNCTVDGYLLAKHTYLTAGRAEAAAEAERLRTMILAHNEDCESACKARGDACLDYTGRGRMCPDCPLDWQVDPPCETIAAK